MSAWFCTISWHSGALRLAAVLVRVAVVLVRVAVVLVRVAVVLVRVAAVLIRVYPGLFRAGPGQSLVIRVGAVFFPCHCRVHLRSYRIRPWTYRVSTGVVVARRPSMLEIPKVRSDHPGSWSGAVRGSPGPPYSSVLIWDCSFNANFLICIMNIVSLYLHLQVGEIGTVVTYFTCQAIAPKLLCYRIA